MDWVPKLLEFSVLLKVLRSLSISGLHSELAGIALFLFSSATTPSSCRLGRRSL